MNYADGIDPSYPSNPSCDDITTYFSFKLHICGLYHCNDQNFTDKYFS